MSAFSLDYAMAMLLPGARGQTLEQIRTQLYFPADNVLFLGYEGILRRWKDNDKDSDRGKDKGTDKDGGKDNNNDNLGCDSGVTWA